MPKTPTKKVRLVKVQVQPAIEHDDGGIAPQAVFGAKDWPRQARELKLVYLVTPTFVIDDGRHLVEHSTPQPIRVGGDEFKNFPRRLTRLVSELEERENEEKKKA